MPNHRLPADVAEVTGAAARSPGRHKDRKAPRVRPLGQPYAWMNDDERRVWAEMAEELPWLRSPDRRLLAQAVRLAARMESGEFGLTAMTEFRMTMRALGGTPGDRTRMPEGEDEGTKSTASEFLN